MVVVAAHPKLTDKPLKRMGCAFVLPEHLSNIARIEVADGHVWIEDGPVYLAVRPLGAFDWGRGEPVRIESANRYRFVWLPNNQGPERTFNRAELERTFNGFILVVGTAREGSFQDFRQRVGRGELLDYFAMDSRTVRYHLDGLHLGINYGLVSHGVRFPTVNGKPVARPAWQADGLPPERLPFLGSEAVPNSLELPFEHLKVIWAPQSPWQIFSRGNRPEEETPLGADAQDHHDGSV